ncbi:hypothetical protein [Azoarcus sp. KH32C]|uniref:hypothetical protein n=1 Tax=Azoarcus sp. KH32C TaxID=748247 RepID=UPI0002386A91|nr:hypothetical protein [Azoarcus sp. KH32C]BAL25389.1 hypothetical protein AZKH_3091 [Azoarcus sp. KH32C]
MKIASASVQLQSSHVATSSFESNERLEMWVGNRRGGANGGNDIGTVVREAARAQVEVSKEARALQEAGATDNDDDTIDADPRMRFLKQLIEALTGKSVKTVDAKDLRPDAAPAAPTVPDAPAPAQQQGPRRARFGVDYQYHAKYQEHEQTRFAAQGTVKTADGQEIRFKLDLSMERNYSETKDVQMRLGDAQMKDPLVLDFAGPAAALSDTRFSFDLDADGTAESLPMLAGGTGYLAIDRNDNGRIDDGGELFGPSTGSGFGELAALDSDKNGWIDESDAAFGQLRVWSPATEGAGSLKTAAEAGVGALYLGNVATPFSLRGAANNSLGEMRTSGVYLHEDGSAGTVNQIDLSV